jgi:hypothetical protein
MMRIVMVALLNPQCHAPPKCYRCRLINRKNVP